MFENIEKALTIMLLAIGVKLDGEDEQGKKGKKDLFGCNHGLKTVCVQVHTKIYFRKYFRNTNLTKNIVMAVPVTMNSTLDNAGVLDPLLKFIIKN